MNSSCMNNTISSTNTISEMKITKNPFFKLFYLFATFINSILGLNLILKFHEFMRKTDNLNLLLYIILYTFKWPLAFLLGIILTLFIITVKKLFITQYSEENTPNYIGHLFVCSIYNLVFIYIGSVFWSIYLLVMLMRKDSQEYKMNFREKYELIYIFLTVNFLISFIIFSLFLYFLLIMNIPFRFSEDRYNIDEDFINKIKEEINAVNMVSGTLGVNKESKSQNEHLFKDLEHKNTTLRNENKNELIYNKKYEI